MGEYAEVIYPNRPPIVGEWFGFVNPTFGVRICYPCLEFEGNICRSGKLLNTDSEDRLNDTIPFSYEQFAYSDEKLLFTVNTKFNPIIAMTPPYRADLEMQWLNMAYPILGGRNTRYVSVANYWMDYRCVIYSDTQLRLKMWPRSLQEWKTGRWVGKLDYIGKTERVIEYLDRSEYDTPDKVRDYAWNYLYDKVKTLVHVKPEPSITDEDIDN